MHVGMIEQFWSTAFEGTMGTITVFVTSEVQIFNYALKYF